MDSNDEDGNPVTVQVIRQLKIEIRNQPVIKGKKLDVLLFNSGMDVLSITKIEVTWPDGNGALRSVSFGGNNTIWTGSVDWPTATLEFDPYGGLYSQLNPDPTLSIDPGEGLKLGFFFQRKTQGGTYTIRVTLEGGLTEEVVYLEAAL